MSTITITALTEANANGVAPIPFTFQALSAAEIGVKRAGVLKTKDVDYTVTLNGDGTGSITPLATWGVDPVIIYSDPNLQQPANFTRFGAFFPDQFVPPLDRLARTSIWLSSVAERAIRAPVGETLGELPSAATRALGILGFDALGDLLSYPPGAFTGPQGPGGDLSKVPNRATLAGINGTAVDMVRWLYEAGRKGLFTAVLAASIPAPALAADTAQGLYIPSTSNPAIVWKRELQNEYIDPRWFGAPVNNGVNDDAPAINTALRVAEALSIAGSQAPTLYRGTYEVRLGVGQWGINSSLEPLATLRLKGVGGKGWGAPTQVRVAAGVTAIRAQAYNTSGAATVDGPHFSGDHLEISGIYFIGGFANGNEAEAHGIHAKRLVHCYDCTFDGFEGDGFYGHAISGGGAPYEGNINVSRLVNCDFVNCRSGVSLQWADANACDIIACSFIGNRRWGDEDRSFLGNKRFGGHHDVNARTAWNTGLANRPCSYVSQGGNQYYAIDGQEVWASANAPTGTTADNQGWAYWQAGGVSAITGVPAWFNGIAVRSGGPMIAAGVNNSSRYYSPHVEINGVSQFDQNATIDGASTGECVKVSGAAIFRNRMNKMAGTTNGMQFYGNVKVAGDFNGDSASNFFGSTTNGGTGLTLLSGGTPIIFGYTGASSYGEIWVSYGGIAGMLIRGSSKVRFDIGGTVGTEVANIQSDGFHVTGLGAFSGALTASNLSGTNTGDQFTAIAQNTIIGRTAAGAGVASALTTLPTATIPAFAGGDVTGAGGSLVLSIANNAVTYAKFQQVAASSLVGNPTGAGANAQGITLAGNLGFSGTTLRTQTSTNNVLLGRTTAGAGVTEELTLAGGLAFSGTTLTAAGALTPTSVAATGVVTSSGGMMGYATGAGGTVAQLTSKTTAVTLNKVCGQFTTNAAALAAAGVVTFQVNNSNISATDILNVNLQSGQATTGTYRYWIEKVAAGSFQVTIENRSAGSLSEALVFNFAAQKAVNA